MILRTRSLTAAPPVPTPAVDADSDSTQKARAKPVPKRCTNPWKLEEETDWETDDTETEEEEETGGDEVADNIELDDMLTCLIEKNDAHPILRNDRFLAYANRIDELDPFERVLELLTDSSVSEKKKIRVAELQLMQLTFEPLTVEYLEMRSHITDYIKSIELKKKISAGAVEAKKNLATSNKGLVERLCTLPNTCAVKHEIAGRLREMFKMDKCDSEYAKLCSWVDMAITVTAANACLAKVSDKNVRNTLLAAQVWMDKSMHGIQHVKREVLVFMHRRLTEPRAGLVLALVGPQGTGKTTMAKAIAAALQTELTMVSVAGMTDMSVLTGHSYTYVGSQPGVVAIAVARHGPRHVMLLDELDKASEPVQNALLHILDPSQNNAFHDTYLGSAVPIDLSGMVFVVTANSVDTIPRPLLDRTCVCYMPDYSLEEKITILCEFTAMRLGACIDTNVARKLVNAVSAATATGDGVGMRPFAQALQAVVSVARMRAVLAEPELEPGDNPTIEVTVEMVDAYVREQREMQDRAPMTTAQRMMFT
jgi:ATP-dependent Lon protease